jgi:hypothetical protein
MGNETFNAAINSTRSVIEQMILRFKMLADLATDYRGYDGSGQ